MREAGDVVAPAAGLVDEVVRADVEPGRVLVLEERVPPGLAAIVAAEDPSGRLVSGIDARGVNVGGGDERVLHRPGGPVAPPLRPLSIPSPIARFQLDPRSSDR